MMNILQNPEASGNKVLLREQSFRPFATAFRLHLVLYALQCEAEIVFFLFLAVVPALHQSV